MKKAFQLFAIVVFLFPLLTWAYDWEQEESGAEREVHLNRARSYAGGADEQELKVQNVLPNPPRSPSGMNLMKSINAETDDESNSE